MTDDQFNQFFGLLTKFLNGIERLEEKIDKIISRSEKREIGQIRPEEGQNKIEDRQIVN